MNKEKWNDIWMEECGKTFKVLDVCKPWCIPEGWSEYKVALQNFIKNVDEMYEVYNEENKNG